MISCRERLDHRIDGLLTKAAIIRIAPVPGAVII